MESREDAMLHILGWMAVALTCAFWYPRAARRLGRGIRAELLALAGGLGMVLLMTVLVTVA